MAKDALLMENFISAECVRGELLPRLPFARVHAHSPLGQQDVMAAIGW